MKFTVQKEIQVDRPRIMRVIKFCGRGQYTGRVQGEAGRSAHSTVRYRKGRLQLTWAWKPKGVED